MKLAEAINYTPEKIDEFVQKAAQDYEKAGRAYNAIRSKVMDISIGYATENAAEVKELKNTVNKLQEYLGKVHGTYFNIVDMYDYLDAPKNVEKLEKYTEKLDDYKTNVGYVADALDSILEAAEYLGRGYDVDQERGFDNA